jgi:antibiotic biosynthesis monooxygenase (ABM) superfamily enzyme
MPVSVVIQTRVRDGGDAAYEAWQRQVGAELTRWPGFVSQEVRPPSPPIQVDWVVVQNFADEDSAKEWFRSSRLAELRREVAGLFVGPDDISLSHGEVPKTVVCATISCQVPAGLEDEFTAWQARVFQAESQFDGFIGHRLEPPVPGLNDRWVISLTFAGDEAMQRWLDSPERARLMVDGERFQRDLRIRKSVAGFDFWFGGKEKEPPISPMKSNLLVLLVLYPIVFLWGYFISTPFIDSQGVPFWLSLFIGNLVSTQLLGWLVVPKTFQAFAWWLPPGQPVKRDVKGYALVILGYVLSMALYAWLLTLKH